VFAKRGARLALGVAEGAARREHAAAAAVGARQAHDIKLRRARELVLAGRARHDRVRLAALKVGKRAGRALLRARAGAVEVAVAGEAAVDERAVLARADSPQAAPVRYSPTAHATASHSTHVAPRST